MVEENGTASIGDQLNNSGQDPHNNSSSSSGGPGIPLPRGGPPNGSASSSTGPSPSESAAAAAAAANIVQILPASQTSGSVQAQSVIQQNQQSVIQTAAGQMPALPRGVLLVCNKPSSVIHTTQGSLQAIQTNSRSARIHTQIKPEPHVGSGGSGIMTDTNSDDTMSDDESSPKKRRDLLTRRPSYRKILSDLGGAEIANAQGDGPGLHAIAATGGGVVQYSQAQDGQIYVPHLFPNAVMGGNVQLEDQSRKREMRLQKNREAARECRRKKKEYIKCLENRVAVLENQNKALIEELKSLKELYCQQKND
uniref:Putative camp response element binding protein n=1 Tax=Culex tarsalis TaxID=7177 RepID=A0A1Q3F963_CULTA